MNSSNTENPAQGFLTRQPPTFDSIDEERAHRKQRLAATCRIFGARGFAEGLLGHVTVRDPESPEQFWANPLATPFTRMRVSDLVLVDHSGNLIHGRQPVNPVGVMLHSAIHRAYPEVTAVCHAHSTYGSAWSALGRPIAPITQDTAIFHGDQAIITEPRLAMDSASADQFAAAFAGKRTGIQVGHGLFTVGQSVDEAAWRFISMERACQVQLLAAAAGEPQQWPEEMTVGLKNALGSADFCWLAFQTLWDELLAADTDFLD
jgi:ribulose-5-phosphate 4-epimerase/fuculose-1-phosphate aldolase